MPRRFFAYLRDSGRIANGRPVVSKEALTDFLSQLATRLNVGSSTQNQAFGALLFLYRKVLQIEMADLERTVRARRGQHLPTVTGR